MRPKPSPAFTTFDSSHRFLLHFCQREHFSFFPNSCDTRRRGDVEDKQGWMDGERERGGGGGERKCR